MRLSTVLAVLAAAAPAATAKHWNMTGAYWDAKVSTQSGRPGYSIRDLEVTFHQPVSEEIFQGKCHYSFVPQGTSPPAETDTCSTGLKYTWDYTTFTMTQDIIFDGVDVTLYAIPPTLASQCSGSGSGGGRFCTYTGKAELSHYCSDDGCYPPDGNACGEFCEPESES